MAVGETDTVALIKAESLEMGKPGGIEMYIINERTEMFIYSIWD